MVTTIVLADDHAILRRGIKALLQADPDLQVVGEAANGKEAIVQIEKVTPDILITDITMPIMNGIKLTELVCKLWPKTAVIILSMHSAYPYVAQAFEAGAKGYVVKDAGPEQLNEAIREVLADRTYLSPQLSHDAIQRYGHKNKATAS